MNILLVSSYYLPMLGGVQTTVHALAKQFQARGHAVKVVANRHPRTLPGQETLDGVAVRRLPFLHPQLHHFRARRPDLFAGGLLYGPLTVWRLQRLFHEFRPEVINLHHPDHPCLFVLWLCKRYDVRLVVSLQGGEIFSYAQSPPDQQKLLRAVLSAADRVTAVSKYLLDKAAGIDPTIGPKGYVLPNGVDLERFDVAQGMPAHSRPYVFAAGRLAAEKGFDVLVNAFGRVSRDYPELDLLIAGEGDQRPVLETRIAQLGLQDRAYLIGRASPEQMANFLRGCRAAVVPSRREACGIVAVEAIAAGAPVVASRVGGLPELLDGLDGAVLVAPDDPDALAVSISELLSIHQPGEQDHAAGVRRRELLSRYAWPAIASEYLRLFSAES